MEEFEDNKRTWRNPAELTPDENAEMYFKELGLSWQELQGKKVLDLGAGPAKFAQAARARGIDVISLDKHPEWWAHTGGPAQDVPYVVGDGLRMPFQEGVFDLVVGRASVHSIVNDRPQLDELVTEVKRVLAPGGEFRFDTGFVLKEINEAEWKEWNILLEKVLNQEQLTPEEDARGEELFNRVEEEKKEDEEFENLTTEERVMKVKDIFLKKLQKIDPTAKTFLKDPKSNEYYYLLTKEESSSAQT